MLEQVGRTYDLLTNLLTRFPDKEDMLCRMVNGDWEKTSVRRYYEKSHEISYALAYLGYGKGDKAISVMSNRPEWNFIDMGLNMAQMIHVPVYPTLSTEEFLHIFSHSDAKLIFIGNESLLKKLEPIILKMDKPLRIILVDNSDSNECLNNLYQIGQKHKDEMSTEIERRKEATSPGDVASIIYTSGTTGTPKGVMLSHENLMFNSYGHAVKQTVTSNQKMVSFLPLCHVYERSMNYEYQYIGIGIYYAESLGTIARDIADCHADGFCAVPRVLEMMYNKLDAAGKSLKGIRRILYRMAWNYGNSYDNDNHSPLYLRKRNFYDRLLYSRWREMLGGHELLIVSGGSSIQPKILRLFNAARMHIYEGYGMTETSPVIAVNSPMQGFNRIGTVGKALEGTELKIAEDGEILTKGPHVMLGYYKDPEETARIIDAEGFLHTGDIGHLIDGEYLQITDRKKEIFKLSLGKYIAPQTIENRLKESLFIENCIVIGENQKFASCILTPEFKKLHYWAAKHNICYENNDELIRDPKVMAKIHSEIERVNADLAPHEHIKRERIVKDEWTTANKMLSQTLKLKRANIQRHYADIIHEIYKN